MRKRKHSFSISSLLYKSLVSEILVNNTFGQGYRVFGDMLYICVPQGSGEPAVQAAMNKFCFFFSLPPIIRERNYILYCTKYCV